MSSKPVRIGIIGGGGIVKSRHLPALKAMPEVQIVAVCNSTLESSRRFCAEFTPEAEPMDKWWELASRDDINVVWIGTTPYLHSEISIYALRAGKHVFCQARMAMNQPEAQLMWEASMSNPELVAALCPPPYGMKGGMPGDVGRNYVIRTDSMRIDLKGADKIEMNAGDVFVIETPGGGGYGKS